MGVDFSVWGWKNFLWQKTLRVTNRRNSIICVFCATTVYIQLCSRGRGWVVGGGGGGGGGGGAGLF